MQDYEVNPGINKFFPLISSFKFYSFGYLRKQQNETGYFYKITLPHETKLKKNIKIPPALEYQTQQSLQIRRSC